MSEIKPVATWETHCKRNPSCAEQAHLYASEAKSIEIEELRAAYEALQKENAELKRNHKFTCENLANTVPFIEELEQKNAAQEKRISELEQEKYVRDLVVISLHQVVDMRVDSLEQYMHATALNKKFIGEIESLRKQCNNQAEIHALRMKMLEHQNKSLLDQLVKADLLAPRTYAIELPAGATTIASKNGE